MGCQFTCWLGQGEGLRAFARRISVTFFRRLLGGELRLFGAEALSITSLGYVFHLFPYGAVEGRFPARHTARLQQAQWGPADEAQFTEGERWIADCRSTVKW